MAFDPDAYLTLDTSEGEKRLDRTNSALFTHIGDLAMYDHVFVQTNTEDDNQFGAYLFRHSSAFHQIVEYMTENQFPMHLNSFDVATCDRDAFDHTLERESQEEVPEEWLE